MSDIFDNLEGRRAIIDRAKFDARVARRSEQFGAS